MDDTKDQNVMSFMMQLVQERHGDEVDLTLLNSESDRLYNKFGDDLVKYFEPQLTEDQKVKFDEMVSKGSDQDAMMNFLMDNISDLEEQIMNVLIAFREDYLAGKMDIQGENQ